MQHLFVYGTLLKPLRERLSISFRNLEFPQPAFLYGKLLDLGEYPGLVLTGDGKVYGELYALADDYSFDELDFYEDFNPNTPEDSEYVRTMAKVYTDECTSYSAWAYIYNQNCEHLPEIESGHYLEYIDDRLKATK